MASFRNEEIVAFSILAGIPLLAASVALLRRANHLTWGKAVGVGLGLAVLTCGMFVTSPPAILSRRPLSAWESIPMIISFLTLPLLGIPFLAMLVQRWLGPGAMNTNEADQKPNFRAMLTPGMLIWGGLLVLALAIVTELPLLVGAMLLIALLVADPAVRWGLSDPQPSDTSSHANPTAPLPPLEARTTAPPSLSAEREKVLELVASDRITAEEGAELLNALAVSSTGNRRATLAINPQRRLVLAGAVLLLIGFFMPWFSVNAGKEMTRLQREMSAQVSGMGDFHVSGMEMPQVLLKTPSVQVTGPEIPRALGWLVLLLGIAVAGLPWLHELFRAQTRRVLEGVGLGLIGLLLLYLLTTNLRYVTIGLLVVMCGYALELFGCLRDWRHRPQGHAT